MKMKRVKNIVLLLAIILCVSMSAQASNKHRLGNGVTIEQFGNTWVIEDDNRQMSISVEIAQEGVDRKNNEMMYKVICDGRVKKVAKWALRGAIAAGINAASTSGGSTLLVSASALAADIIYDEACDYWKEKGDY